MEDNIEYKAVTKHTQDGLNEQCQFEPLPEPEEDAQDVCDNEDPADVEAESGGISPAHDGDVLVEVDKRRADCHANRCELVDDGHVGQLQACPESRVEEDRGT